MTKHQPDKRNPSHFKGKTYEEIYGIKDAKTQIKKRKKSMLGKHWIIKDTSKMKGRVPWNKGLTKNISKLIRKMSTKSSKTKKENFKNKEYKKIYLKKNEGCFKKGNIPPFKGKIKETYEPLKRMSENKERKRKIKKYMIEKWKDPMYKKRVSEKISQTKIEKGYQLNFKQMLIYKLYYRKVFNETKKFKKELFKNWNGLDYYTGKYIKNKRSIKNKATVDHKYSVLYGFINKINPFIIGNIDNLCICSKSINSSKSYKIESTFKKELKEVKNAKTSNR